MKRIEKVKRNNPSIYSRTEQEGEPRSFRGVVPFIILVLFTGLVYLVVFSGAFKIKEIEVEGYSYPDTIKEIVKDQAENSIISENILFFSTRNLKKVLLGDPKVKDLTVARVLPGKLRIEIEEEEPAIIWSSAGDKFLVSGRGDVMGPAKEDNLPVIYDAANIKTKAGERVASPTFIKFILGINDGFEAATGTKINKITLFDIMSDVHILSSDGWTVYLNAEKKYEDQLKDLGRVLAEVRKTQKKIQYIDLRLDNRVFYK